MRAHQGQSQSIPGQSEWINIVAPTARNLKGLVQMSHSLDFAPAAVLGQDLPPASRNSAFDDAALVQGGGQSKFMVGEKPCLVDAWTVFRPGQPLPRSVEDLHVGEVNRWTRRDWLPENN